MKLKKALSLLLALLVLCACLAGCGKGGDKKPKVIDITKLSQALDGGSLFGDSLSPLDEGTARSLFGLNSADVTKCVVKCSAGATPEAYALFQAADTDAAGRVLQAVNDYIAMQKAVFNSYAPDQLTKLDSAIVQQTDVYIIYVCASDTAAAQAILNQHT